MRFKSLAAVQKLMMAAVSSFWRHQARWLAGRKTSAPDHDGATQAEYERWRDGSERLVTEMRLLVDLYRTRFWRVSESDRDLPTKPEA